MNDSPPVPTKDVSSLLRGSEDEEILMYLTAMGGIWADEALPFDEAPGCSWVERANRAMVGVRDEYGSTSACGLLSSRCKPFLIVPGEVCFIVADESIVVMGDCVSGIAVDDVARASVRHDSSEILYVDGDWLKKSTCLQEKILCP